MFKILTAIFSISLIFLFSCTQSEETDSISDEPGYVQFFNALAEKCGEAHPGQLLIQPETVNMFTGTEMMAMHVRECSETQLKIPFHIENEETGEWNRSRTWIITLHEDGLELRHDHRMPDGSDDDVTMYGGFSVDEGTANTQRFQSEERTAQAEGDFRGWRIEFIPGERYTYGTIWQDEWNIMVQFDLTENIETPPAPWGHE